MSTRVIRVGLGQMRVRPGEREANVRQACVFIREGAAEGAELMVLPEALTLGWTDPSAIREAEPIPEGPSCVQLRKAARDCGVFVCAGLVERSGTRVFNAAVLIGPDGEVLLRHRKLNELGLAHDVYGLGDGLGVADTRLGRIGVMICADAFAPGQVISRALGYMGADLIVSPCSWAVPAGHDPICEPYGRLWVDNYGPVARDFHLSIVGVSNVGWIKAGAWQGRKCIGCSMIVGPSGKAVARAEYGVDAEQMLVSAVELEERPARGDGWAELWQARDGSTSDGETQR